MYSLWYIFKSLRDAITANTIHSVGDRSLQYHRVIQTWPYTASLVVAAENLRDAAMGNAELPADIARSDSLMRQMHDAVANVIGQRAAVHEDTA